MCPFWKTSSVLLMICSWLVFDKTFLGKIPLGCVLIRALNAGILRPGMHRAIWWYRFEPILCRTTMTMSIGWEGGAPAKDERTHTQRTCFVKCMQYMCLCFFSNKQMLNNMEYVEQTNTQPTIKRNMYIFCFFLKGNVKPAHADTDFSR